MIAEVQEKTISSSTSIISEEEALSRGMEEKSKEFVEAGAEVYSKAWIKVSHLQSIN